MRRLHGWLKKWEDRTLARFNRWFCSEGGVYQTFLVVLAVVILEAVDRSLDPHAFVLMAVLTVYSGITQPMLAYANTQAALQADIRLDQVLQELEQIKQRLDIKD